MNISTCRPMANPKIRATKNPLTARQRCLRRSSMWSPKLIRVSWKKSSGSMSRGSWLMGGSRERAHGGTRFRGRAGDREGRTLECVPERDAPREAQGAGGGATDRAILANGASRLKHPESESDGFSVRAWENIPAAAVFAGGRFRGYNYRR